MSEKVQYIDENLKIEIRPIPNSKGIQDFSKDLQSFAKVHTIPCLVNPVTHRYETGLSDEDKKYLESIGNPYDISDVWKRNEAHPFWDSLLGKMDLQPRPDFLYPGKNILDFIKYKYLLKSKFVYSSETEMLTRSKPMATHYIYNDSVETGLKASKIEKRNNLIKKFDKLSLEKKRDYILIINNENTDNKKEDYLLVKFEDILNNKEKTSMLETLLSKDAVEVGVLADVKKALAKTVLTENKKGIFYFDTNLGHSVDDVVKTLSDPSFQELYISIKSKL